MQTELRIKLATLRFETRKIRLAERHEINNRRRLLGTWWKHHKRHNKTASRPEPIAEGKMAPLVKGQTEDGKTIFGKTKDIPKEAETYAKESYERFWGLSHHRQTVVRKAARNSHIALGFLRDRPFKSIEQGAYSMPDWAEVEKVAGKHYEGDVRTFAQTFGAWMADAKEYFKAHGNLNVTV